MASGLHSEILASPPRGSAASSRALVSGPAAPRISMRRVGNRPLPRSCSDAALRYARENSRRFVDELKSFLRFPSISTLPKHAGDVRDCAHWLASHLRSLGVPQVHIVSTPRHPIVMAFSRHRPGRPTLLIYGHYDVQPVDPLKQWRSPPFVPTIRGANLYARGASDDKGQLFLHIKALESYLRTSGLPLNVKCVFEGEEEIGSPHFAEFLRKNKSLLGADLAVISDTRILGPTRPVITYRERGLLSLELSLRGPKQDLHSGAFGGAIHNPAQALCEIIAQLHDRRGRIAIPGFYDSVAELPSRERAYLQRHAPSEAKLLQDASMAKGWGEPGFSLFERTAIRPALIVNGISGGYRGPGGKGIIPARASAKISFRLVPNQDPSEVEEKLRHFLADIAPPTLRLKLRVLGGNKPVSLSPKHPGVRAAASAYRQAFGADPVFLPSGGTIPVVNSFEEILGVHTVLMGFALSDDRMHAPNEKFFLPNFRRGIATSILFLDALCKTLGLPDSEPSYE